MASRTRAETVPATPSRKRRLRSDAIRNERELVAAMGSLLKESPQTATMPAVAKAAGLSPATAYRYFPTLDALHRRFMLSTIEELQEATADLRSSGSERFGDVLRCWLDILSEYGSAMVHVASREGFLTRLKADEPHTRAIKAAWGEAISGMLAECGEEPSMLDLALALFNSMVNAREILDLRASSGLSDEQVVAYLTAAFAGALTGLRAVHSGDSER
ncbi:TetR/AcrR family transcriptional regulator [Microbacterium halotolerans]|uniref:TetR/AcrR family transcriptional regulator n=1 Tax=Microbacterium halotolerans TaxID=246613 RepID=UPI001F095900|nr:TetR/AcrR family transcriptional regulator [Microbacterium halotolerans]